MCHLLFSFLCTNHPRCLSYDILTLSVNHIKPGVVVIWIQALCLNDKKSFAFGESGLEEINRLKVPTSIHFSNCVLKGVVGCAKIVECSFLHSDR